VKVETVEEANIVLSPFEFGSESGYNRPGTCYLSLSAGGEIYDP